jgi:hypothetical protein
MRRTPIRLAFLQQLPATVGILLMKFDPILRSVS